MKGRIWKKAAALSLAALLVTGGVPISPVADIAREISITASAENNQIPDFLLPYADGGKKLSPNESIYGKDENDQYILFDVVCNGKDYANTYQINLLSNNALRISFNTNYVMNCSPTSDTSSWFAEYTDGKLYLSSREPYAVTIAESITNGTVSAENEYYAANDTVTLTVNPDDNYSLDTLTVTKEGGGTVETTKVNTTTYTFAMPDCNVTVSAAFVIGYQWNDTNTELTLYHSGGWEYFCSILKETDEGFFTGKTVKLDHDISVTVMAGDRNKFTGTFDGRGHSITLALGTSEYSAVNHLALFKKCKGCVIQNLHVDGSIVSDAIYAAGFIGSQYGSVTLRNCRSSVVISGMRKNGCYYGGFVGLVNSAANLTIEGCVFDGKLLTTNDTNACGGFVGGNRGTVAITDSLYFPASINAGETEISATKSYTFVKNLTLNENTGTDTLTNCYYTRSFGTAQGKAAHTITAGQNVSAALSGNPTEYDVSGITAYANGLQYGDVIYAGNGDSVALTLGHDTPTGYTFSGYTAGANTLDGTENPYTLTMPDEDVTVSAAFTHDPAHFSQDGDTYTIHDATGWDIFCDLIEEGETFSEKTVILDDDISVTRMAGNRTHEFGGGFDGREHTINAAISGSTGGEALFPAIDGAAIKDLTLSGSITGGQHCGALVGFADGTNTIENINVTADVSLDNSIAANKAHHGGVIGHALSSDTTLRGVVYSGTISSKDFYSDIVNVGGLVGWADDAVITIEDSLFAGTYSGGTLFHPILCKTGNKTVTGTFTNVYYTAVPTVTNSNYYVANAGKATHTITAGQDTTLALGGTATEYSVSGITAYADNSGLKYGDTIYAGNEDNVTLALAYNGTPDEGCIFSGFTADKGVLTENTLTMPDENVTVTAQFAEVFTGESISLGGDFGVMFYLDPEFVSVGDSVSFSYVVNANGTDNTVAKTYTIQDEDLKTLTYDDTDYQYYAAPCYVNAAEMTSRITAAVTVNGEPCSVTTSVRAYADKILSNQAYSAAHDLTRKMLDYGAKAQLKFGRNIDDLANAGLAYTMPEVTSATIDPDHSVDMETGLSDYGLAYEGTSLLYLNNTTIRHYYSITDDTLFDAVKNTITFDAAACAYGTKGNYIYFEKPDIGADELGTAYALKIGTGDTAHEYAFSALDYSKGVLEIYEAGKAFTANDADLARATYLYAAAASAYKENGGVQ